MDSLTNLTMTPLTTDKILYLDATGRPIEKKLFRIYVFIFCFKQAGLGGGARQGCLQIMVERI